MAECCIEHCYRGPRVVDAEGFVVESERTIYLFSEADILSVAEERGLKLTEPQLDALHKYCDNGYDPDGRWHDVVEIALDNALQIEGG